ncbi:MAG: hypothetical protein HYU52_01805 [Acidobacteria bacterium]|nr:hypothetical protein [Acidobacteriota bacterium]
MGILTWLLGSAAALLACRFIPLGRTSGRVLEALCGLTFALAGGLVATRLDFGGWNVAEPRAVLFCAVSTSCGVAIYRCVGALGPRRSAQ